jgi:hypothetical protein
VLSSAWRHTAGGPTPFQTMTADEEGEQLEAGRSYLAP